MDILNPKALLDKLGLFGGSTCEDREPFSHIPFNKSRYHFPPICTESSK